LRGRGPGKRRLAIAAVVALAVAIAAPLIAPSAGAVVGNPGKIDVAMSLSVFTPAFTFPEMSTSANATAIVKKNGLIQIPRDTLAFDPVQVQVNLPAPVDPASVPDSSTTSTPPALVPTTVTVQAFATSDFRGAIDPRGGAAFLAGNVQLMISQDGSLQDCPVGPFQVVARTNAQGGLNYSSETGTVDMVDPGFTIDAIPAGAAGCAGLEGVINTDVALPVTTTTTTTTLGDVTTTTAPFPPGVDAPVPSVVMALTFVPALQYSSAQPPPPVHSGQSTTTTPPTDTPTTAASATQSQGPSNPAPPVGQGNPNKRHHPKGNPNKKHHPKGNPNKKRHPKKHKKAVFAAGTAKPKRHHVKRTPGTYLPGGHPATAKPKAKKAAASGPTSRRLSFVTASFIKRPTSALTTGLDLLGLLGLLVFSSLALWLVTTEISTFSASARRQRAHRIAGVTRRS
jgi:hypothetical protein